MIPSSSAQTRVLFEFRRHPSTKTKLRPGKNGCGVKQPNGVKVNIYAPWPASRGIRGVSLFRESYEAWPVLFSDESFARATARRALALLACAVLLYFAGGGSHSTTTNGPENACHVCQSLHALRLAPAALDLVAAPELIARYSSLPEHAAPSNSFSLHRASRAPPSA